MPLKFTCINKELDHWLNKQKDSCFPPHDTARGELPYAERYRRIGQALAPYQTAVEKGALLKSAQEWRKKVLSQIQKDFSGSARNLALSVLAECEPLVYLNNHGQSHVQKVIHRVSSLLQNSQCAISSYEGYLLLCGIQFHDVGNIFGRADHELKCKEIMEKNCKQIIKDAVERDTIIRIATAHGGYYSGDKDTIQALRKHQTLFEQPVREQLLAALLRFSDELADDSSRSAKTELDEGLIPTDGVIYHEYSQALHSVVIEQHRISLGFQFQSSLATKSLRKNGKERYLLDEIYERTLKMERERRYCMRYLRPNISIDQIGVEIVVQASHNALDQDRITYTLEEKGYPLDPPLDIKSVGCDLRSGDEERQYLLKKWKLT